MDEVQRIVDEVGTRLERAAAVDDPELRLLAYGPHFSRVDEARLSAILHRKALEEAKTYAFSMGIADEEGPFRLPPNAELGIMARVGAPIRFQDVHLGYLWLIDEDQSLTADNLQVVEEACEDLAVVMYRNRLLHQVERARERELLRDLFSEEPALREHGRVQLIDQDYFVRGGRPIVIVLEALGPSDSNLDDGEVAALERALETGRLRVSSRHAIHLVRVNHGVLMVAANDRALAGGKNVRAFAETFRDGLLGRLPAGWRAVVGIGEVQPDLSLAHVSYVQARRAARIVEVAPSFGDIGEWGSLGIYRLLSQLPLEEVRNSALHPGFAELFNKRGGVELASTLEAYLDHACDAKATAETLFIHRSTLYSRLARVEEIAGVSLKSGDDRLALHLSLKVARLAGLLTDS